MRTIDKGAEPSCLAGLRREAKRIEQDAKKPPASKDWDPKNCGDPIREALCREQGGLCAYCMRRIRPRGDSMKIEHFVARSRDPRRMYDWDNLLGVCHGILRGGLKGEVHICDQARGNKPLHVHPAKPPPRPEAVFEFDNQGKVLCKGKQAEADRETLNLHDTRLTQDRRAVIDDLRKKLRSRDDIASIRRLLETARTPTRDGLPQYARVAIEYLERKLRSRGVESF